MSATRAASSSTRSPVVDDLVASLRGVLADELVGIYLYGSMVVGGFDHDVSDADLITVTTVDASDLDLAKLGRRHDDLVRRHPDWEDRLEIVCVGAATLRTYREGGQVAVISPGEPFHLVDGAELWIQNWYLAGTTSIALEGPARELIFPAVSLDEFVSAVTLYAAEVKGRDLKSMAAGSRAYTVLTMCRALATVSTQRPCSKQEGALWVLRRHPQWDSLIEAALVCRLSGGRRGFDDPAVVAEAERVIGQIADEIARLTPTVDQKA